MAAACESRGSSTQKCNATLEKSAGPAAPRIWRRRLGEPAEPDPSGDQGGHRQRRTAMTNTQYGRITAGLIGMWFVFALLARLCTSSGPARAVHRLHWDWRY